MILSIHMFDHYNILVGNLMSLYILNTMAQLFEVWFNKMLHVVAGIFIVLYSCLFLHLYKEI